MEGDADRVERIRAYPRRRTYLLPALHDVQHALGWLPGESLEMVGAHLRVPKSEVYGVASSFPDFDLTQPAEHVVRVCVGASCRLAGARPRGVRARGLPLHLRRCTRHPGGWSPRWPRRR